MEKYKEFFGFVKEPFASRIGWKDILKTDAVSWVKARFDYTVRLGAIALITGEIGSGKSTALRYAAQSLHPSEYKVFFVTATCGSILELYKQIMNSMNIGGPGSSRAVMTKMIRREIADIVEGKKMKAVLVIDEASLLRMEVLAELHTLCQFHFDAKSWLPIIFAGQSTLVDKLEYRSSAPLASRIIARCHLEGIRRKEMQAYLKHRLKIAGIDALLFDDNAITAIYQGAGGILRKADHLARGALMAAAREKTSLVSAEHVRLAATEIF